MPSYENLLNNRQLEAVKTTSQYVRIIAGAGSGKTRVLTYRISYLISEFHIDPSKILAITFTNKVAREMNNRASALVEDILGTSPFLAISTYHSFCARFLREEHRAFSYPAGFTIFDEEDQKQLISNIAVRLGYKKKDPFTKEATKYIYGHKNRGIYPQDISISSYNSELEKKLLEFYMLYEQEKTFCNALDFDDLLLYTRNILKNREDIREKWADRFDYILVDEFQDTNDVQFELLRLLCRYDTSVYVVGDPDQTIYSWRGANQKIILDFDKAFPNAETVVLNENYRSTKTILDAANKLIANNKKRVPKDLFTNGSKGDAIVSACLPKAEDEAEWVAKQIATISNTNKLPNGSVNYKNIAILYRSSYMTRAVEMALKNRGIPYKIFGGLRFYERMEVKDMLAYFSLLLNEKDNIALERVINVPRRGIGLTSIDKLREEAKSSNESEYIYLKKAVLEGAPNSLPSNLLKNAKGFIEILEETKKELKDDLEIYSSILQNMAKRLGYFDYLTEEEEVGEDRVANVNALFDDIAQYIDKNPDSNFEEYLQNVALLSSQDDINDGNYVSLMTIHVAKGLEFDYVFVIYMNEGAFPNERALAESDRDGSEEERRLAYVAFTRAKKKLFVSCNRSYSFATDSSSSPSMYFKEAGISLPTGESYYSSNSSWTPNFMKKKKKPAFDSGYFKDEDTYEEKEPSYSAPKAETNGITDWSVGDHVEHETFGEGVVVRIIGDNILQIQFDKVGRKSILSTFPKLTRTYRKGGTA